MRASLRIERLDGEGIDFWEVASHVLIWLCGFAGIGLAFLL